jgi:hypothetical protein
MLKSLKIPFITLLLGLSLFNHSAFSEESTESDKDFMSWENLKKEFVKNGLNTKLLSHVVCFFKEHETSVFRKKISFMDDGALRCSGNPSITLDSKRVFAIIDYTVNSDRRRMFIVDRKTGKISMMAVAHGRYEADFLNTELSQNKNSVLQARYYSNEINSNAPSSGFFVAGMEYDGKFGQSLTLHGLESQVNDNACERAVVIHKHLLVSEKKARVLSSGCPMVSKNYIDHVIKLLRAPVSESGEELGSGGVVFIYGEREKNWQGATCKGQFNI